MRGDFGVVVRILTLFQLFYQFISDCTVGRRRFWLGGRMRGCNCFFWSRTTRMVQSEHDYYCLPDPIPQWPQDSGFGTSSIKLGELEVFQITRFEFIWGCNLSVDGKQGTSFYKPIGIPDGFFCLGHYCQSNGKPLRGFVLVAREVSVEQLASFDYMPLLSNPIDYSLLWSSEEGSHEMFEGCGYFWLPHPPEGYKPLGILVTNKSTKPDLEEIKCVRTDLTDACEAHRVIDVTYSKFLRVPLTVWNTRPLHRGIYERGVPVGTFYCGSFGSSSKREELKIACLKNLDPNLHAMPNIDQIHCLIQHYGPTLFFHPNEIYLPSSVSWFFRNGALLYSSSNSAGVAIDSEGSNLPSGGTNDGTYWIDLPSGAERELVKCGNIESAKLYIHVKPALGGTYTDVVFWIFCPFNGPGTLKLGVINIALSKVGQHVGDWEHFTLRINNFTGELWSVYFSQHSGGKWVDPFDLEFIDGNKTIVYSSRYGHASYPYPGAYLQGSQMLRIGVRNDTARSDFYIDSSKQYEIIAAEYLGDGVINEPPWLQFMRKWGPTIVYDSRAELDKIIKSLPRMMKYPMENIFCKLPLELYGEDGPTGPKEKNNWFGDERW